MNGPRVRGFLLKRNAEHRKANLIGPKYKRRWVELAGQTLVYAATQQDLLAGKVFAVREMKWVKADGDNKFQVRFPERVLTFKVEAGGKHERDTWVEALEQAKQLGAETGRRGGSAEKLEQLKKTAEEMLLEHSEDSSSAASGYRASSASSVGGAAVHSHPASAGLPSMSIGISSSRLTETGQRPPSPRLALASAKAGSMFVANSTAGAAVAPLSGSAHFGAYDQENSSDGDEEDGDGNCGGVAACVRMGSLERAAHRLDRDSSRCSAGSSSDVPSPAAGAAAAAAATAVDHGSPAASGSSTHRSKRRESLQRRLTPGVMLINTSPSTQAAGEAVQLDHAGSIERPSPASSSQASPGSSSPAKYDYQQQQQQQQRGQQQQQQRACQDNSFSDEVLTLDLDELAEGDSSNSYSKSTSSPHAALLASQSSGSGNGTARPGTAPSYRPGTPLKSCMRGGGVSSSSSSCLPYVGSASTPASSAEAAAAAAAALASLGLQQRQHGAPSPLSAKAAVGQQMAADRHRFIEGGGQTRDWVEADWDNSSEDDDGPAAPHKAPHVGSSGVGAAVPRGPTAMAPELCTAGVPVGVKGVKADSNWLDDNFDD